MSLIKLPTPAAVNHDGLTQQLATLEKVFYNPSTKLAVAVTCSDPAVTEADVVAAIAAHDLAFKTPGQILFDKCKAAYDALDAKTWDTITDTQRTELLKAMLKPVYDPPVVP